MWYFWMLRLKVKAPWLSGAVQEVQWLGLPSPWTNNCFYTCVSCFLGTFQKWFETIILTRTVEQVLHHVAEAVQVVWGSVQAGRPAAATRAAAPPCSTSASAYSTSTSTSLRLTTLFQSVAKILVTSPPRVITTALTFHSTRSSALNLARLLRAFAPHHHRRSAMLFEAQCAAQHCPAAAGAAPNTVEATALEPRCLASMRSLNTRTKVNLSCPSLL